MTYALVTDDSIVQVGPLPRAWHDGQRWWDLRDPTVDLAGLGWLEVVDTLRPADTDTTTTDYTVTLVDGVPTVTWTVRPWTTDELAARQREANRLTVEQAFIDAVTRLDQLIAAPPLPTVPSGTMTTAQLSNALRTLRDADQDTRAGAQDLASIVRSLTRYVRGDFDTP